MADPPESSIEAAAADSSPTPKARNNSPFSSRSSIWEQPFVSTDNIVSSSAAATAMPFSANKKGTPLVDEDSDASSSKKQRKLVIDEGSEATPVPPQSSSSYLARKAHRYSSMKKRKGPNALLNRLFCNTPGVSHKHSSRDRDSGASDMVVFSKDSPPDVGSSLEDSNTFQTGTLSSEDSQTNENHSPKQGCVDRSCALGKEILEQASENLTLHAEAQVRETIQTSLHDVLLDACSPAHRSSASPPTMTFTISQEVVSESKEVTLEETGSDGIVMTSSGGLIMNTSPSQLVNALSSNTIGSSIFDDDDDDDEQGIPAPPSLKTPREMISSPPFKTPAQTMSERKKLDADYKKVTPVVDVGSEKGGSAFKTPGGLVIPSPFAKQSAGKAVFPTSLDHVYTKASIEKSPQPRRWVIDSPPLDEKKVHAADKKREGKRSAKKKLDLSNVPDQVTLRPGPVTEPSTLSGSGSEDSGVTDPVEDAAPTPPSLVRMTTSYEDLATVPEASTSKETATVEGPTKSQDDGALLEDLLLTKTSSTRTYTEDELEVRIHEAVQQAKKEWKEQDQKLLEEALQSSKSSEGSSSKEEIQQLERKVNEQKDKAALADRLARMRLMEIERMEGELVELKTSRSSREEELKETLEKLKLEKEQQVESIKKELERVKGLLESKERHDLDPDEFERLKKELEGVKKDKLPAAKSPLVGKGESMELKRVKKELAQMKDRLAAKEEASRASTEEMAMLKRELAGVMGRLVAAKEEKASSEETMKLRKELAEVKSQLEAYKQKEADTAEDNATTEELERVQKELADVYEQLATAQKETTGNRALSPPQKRDGDLQRTRKELADVKKQLAAREKELDELRRVPAGRSSSKPGTPVRTPVRSGGKATRQPDSGSKRPEEHDDLAEIHEREKGSLRQQIALLDQQAAKSNQEHELALEELRKASEQEIIHVKKELETRIDQLLEKERELKETLSELHEEKKEDWNGGLREVQKKEDLLQRIDALEKKEKQLKEEHDRTIQELKNKSGAEIQRLRKEMARKEEDQTARELELDQAISETRSFEKEELLETIDKLKQQLASEKSGAVLVNIRVANIEKELEASKRMHEEAMRKLQDASQAEIRRLKRELDGRLAAPVMAMEGHVDSEEIRQLKQQLEKEQREKERMIQELRSQHEELISAAESKFAEEQRTHLEAQKELQKQLEEKTTMLKKEAEEQLAAVKGKREQEQSTRHHELETLRQHHQLEIEAVRKESAEQIAKLKLEQNSDDGHLRATLERQHAEQLCEQQREFCEKLDSLQREYQQKEDRLLDELKVVAQKTSGDETKLLNQIASLKSRNQQYERQIQELEDSHTKELDDLLGQLDLVEAEHKDMLDEREKAVVEKITVISALGSQLAESQKRLKDTEQLAQESLEKVNSLEEKLKSSKSELQMLKETHKKYVANADKLREKACEEAREEMITRAETQFKQANEHYVKLRKQYDVSQKKVAKLESEVKDLKRMLGTAAKEKESCEIDLKAELAKLKASQAKIEADAAQKAKEYRREMEALLQAAKDFETKAEEADRNSQSTQATLAAVVSEKAKLQKEYDEMKSVSEELLAIVEGQQRHEC
jgi:hypothetical protein